MFIKRINELKAMNKVLIQTQSAIITRDQKLINNLQDYNRNLRSRVNYLEGLYNKIDTDSFYPKLPKETQITLGVHEFEVSNRVSFKEIKSMLDLNFKNHYYVFMCESDRSKTVMVKLIFDDTCYNEKSIKALKNIKEYLKHTKR